MLQKTNTEGSVVVQPLKVQRLTFKNYCYLIYDPASADAILIDPAWEFPKIQNAIQIAQCQLKAILLTHHHPDHVDLAEECAKFYDVPVFMSAAEVNTYHFQCFNLQLLSSNTTFKIGTVSITAISTPGHTQGGICYLINNNLFTGDTVFNEGCGVCSGKGASPEDMFNTLQNLKNIIDDSVLMYPGHVFYAPIGQTFAYVKKNNIYLQLTNQTSFVSFRMRKNQNQKKLFNFK